MLSIYKFKLTNTKALTNTMVISFFRDTASSLNSRFVFRSLVRKSGQTIVTLDKVVAKVFRGKNSIN